MSVRNISGKDYLKFSRGDRNSVQILKDIILKTADDEELIIKITALIRDKNHEALRVRPEVLLDRNNNTSILKILDHQKRAEEIVDSINGDGLYFEFLIAAANFIEARRNWTSKNLEAMRKKYREKAKKGGKTRRSKRSGY
jgi:hypothetical protein